MFVIVTAPVAPDTEIPVPNTMLPTPVTAPVSPLKLATPDANSCEVIR